MPSRRGASEADPAAASVSAREQQAAIADILRVISRSPKDLQAVFDVIATSARRFCSAEDAMVALVEGDRLVGKAHDGEVGWVVGSALLDRQLPAARCIVDGRTIHVRDMQTDMSEAFRTAREIAMKYGIRTVLATPMLHDSKAIGSITLRRTDVRPFTEEQIELVRTFADQAAIAIENVRLFNETKDALDQQTATADVLKRISRSAFDLQAVFDVVVENATKLCRGEWGYLFRRDGNLFRIVSSYGGTVELVEYERTHPTPLSRSTLIGRVALDRSVVHLPDLFEDPAYDWPANRAAGVHTVLGVPIFKDEEVVGAIGVARNEKRPFSDSEIRLVRTFADQAAIAMETVRLFNETKEALERQTAIAQVLEAMSGSTTDLTSVFTAIAENAVRLCRARNSSVVQIEGGFGRQVTSAGEFTDIDSLRRGRGVESPIVPDRATLSGRVLLERRTVQIEDVLADPEYDKGPSGLSPTEGTRTLLAVPILQGGEVLGIILARRNTVSTFSSHEIEILETFADQAAIAIENVRLFNETKEALDRQTAVSQVLGEISQSGFELKPVLETVIEHATKLCAAQQGFIYRREGDVYRLAVAQGITPEFNAFTEANPLNPLGRGTITGRVAQDRMTVHVPDVLKDPEYTYWEAQRLGNFRALLGVPMIRDDQVIGVMLLWRTEPQPFTEEQIALVTTFANQATIAIENVRLFDETKEALDRQTALSEILKVISGSTFDLTPVAETVVERAARLCDADYAWIFLPERGQGRATPMALFGDVSPEMRSELMNTYVDFAGHSDLAQTYQEPDVQAVTGWRIGGKLGVRTAVFVPVGRDRGDTGRIVLGRRVVRPFTEQQIDLVEIFADQAAIAIANARLFNEIQDKSRQLEVASRHKSEFLANMSHELRTPLNAIIGFSEVLVQGLFGEVNEKQREYLSDVIGSGQHLLSLINDILDLSKIEAGRMELELSTFNLRDALQSGVTIVRERASRHNITLALAVADDLVQVEADERKVKQIMYNLLSNAVKFTPDGGRVDVTVRRDNGDVRVEVRDNGIGIAEADQARIFEEFQQVGRERSREGTGLGLTLTKRFVELHSGRIWLESAPEQGSTFTFTLPLRQAAPVRA